MLPRRVRPGFNDRLPAAPGKLRFCPRDAGAQCSSDHLVAAGSRDSPARVHAHRRPNRHHFYISPCGHGFGGSVKPRETSGFVQPGSTYYLQNALSVKIWGSVSGLSQKNCRTALHTKRAADQTVQPLDQPRPVRTKSAIWRHDSSQRYRTA